MLSVSKAFPLFVSVTLCAVLLVPTRWLPKLRLVGDSETTGAAGVPVPVNATFCGLPEALSVIATEALRLPVAVGLKVTLIVQLALAARVAGLMGHVLVCEKSPLLVPVMAILEIDSAAFPPFVSVTFCEALLVPTG